MCAARTESEILFDCVGCRNDQPELNEFLKSQKIAHRLEYIKQQLMSNLHVENPAKESPKFDLLPDFLVRQLVRPNAAVPNSGSPELNDQIERQMVLFPEEGECTYLWIRTPYNLAARNGLYNYIRVLLTYLLTTQVH